ncbi:uncharacterized protein LOC123670359 isoform X2 [Melitaea cinxia]|nr:uncharacterized protein LOC123670359 isoform X2 [Melitaea cinxia]XP_045459817.1 uncharacterized protein LOC123670359 isoform X2 [Melitaea cinxia]
MAAVTVNAVPVEKDATILKQDVEVQPQNHAIETSDGIKGQDSGYVKNVPGEHLPVNPTLQPMPCNIITITRTIKPPEMQYPIRKE